jgi:hypothetical protein
MPPNGASTSSCTTATSRLWGPEELPAQLRAAGFVAVEPVTGDFQWVAVARRPA